MTSSLQATTAYPLCTLRKSSRSTTAQGSKGNYTLYELELLNRLVKAYFNRTAERATIFMTDSSTYPADQTIDSLLILLTIQYV